MKIIKYLLYLSFILIVFGFLGHSIVVVNGAKAILEIGIFTLLIFSFIYFVIALIKKRERIEARMLMLANLFIIALFFKLKHYPGGGPLIIIGSQIILIGGIGILAYLQAKNRNLGISIAYLVLGISALYFVFRVQYWPEMITLTGFTMASIGVGMFYLFKTHKSLKPSGIIMLSLFAFILSLVFISKSAMFRFISIEIVQSDNAPEDFHRYAWDLYQENKIEEAAIAIDKAIFELENEQNTTIYRIEDVHDLYMERYLKAKAGIENKSWVEYEEPTVYSY